MHDVIEGDILVPNTLFTGTKKKRTLGLFGIAGNLWPSTVPYQFEVGYRKYFYASQSISKY